MKDELQKASIDDLRERYGDYPVWAAIQRAHDLGVDEGFYEAAKTPSAWCVEDHGEVFKLGDRVWYRGSEQELIGFYRGDSGKVYPRLYESGLVGFSDISHTQPDSWEKLQADIAGSIEFSLVATTTSKETAERIIARAKRLGGCDE